MTAKRTRKARYAPGLATFEEILRAAEDVLAEHGHAALSLRRVAEECGLKIGNLSYYFPAKHDLIKALLDSIIARYREDMDKLEQSETAEPKSILRIYMTQWMGGNEEPCTARLYVELWLMANNDAHVRGELDKFYGFGHQRVDRILARINPALTEPELAALAVFTISTMEGLMVFANRQQPATRLMPWLSDYAQRAGAGRRSQRTRRAKRYQQLM